MIRVGQVVLVLLNAAVVPASVAARAVKCSTECAVDLVKGCCPAVPDSTPIPAGGCSTSTACIDGCLDGNGASCTEAGWFARHPPQGEERDDERALILFDRSCRLGDGRGCYLGMQEWRADYKASRDFEGAVVADHRACQYGQAEACSRLSELHRLDGKYPLYADRACQLGRRDDCINLVKGFDTNGGYFTWATGMGIKVGATGSNFAERHHRACEFAGYVPSCVVLARSDFQRRLPLAEDKLVERQYRLAFDRLNPLCQRGEAAACDALACMNDELLDRPIKPTLYDPGLGPRLFARACALSGAKGCRGLGIALIRGRGIAVDRIAAAVALRQACDLRDGEGCVVLSQITTDRKQAAALIRDACTKGMRGPTGEIFTNVGLSEFPQPYSCSDGARLNPAAGASQQPQ
jgi:uncharacterized protein